MEISKATIIFIIIACILFAIVIWLLFRNLKKSNYDKQNNKAILDSIRHSLETQIYGLNDRLIQTEERWRDVNHLLLRDEYVHNRSPFNLNQKVVYTDFLSANGISENDLIIDSRLIFVLTPFHDHFAEDYEVIKNICVSAGFKCLRGDEIFAKGDIFPEMLKLIIKSALVIANINGRNANVMYELGVAQALGKPVILLADNPSKIPFNIQSQRFLIYENYNELSTALRDELLNIFKRQ
jgi:hypothetical protein